MIYYLVTRHHRYTMGDYLASWGRDLGAMVRVVPYGALPANRDLPAGTYVFSDLERTTALQRHLLAAVADQLAAHPGIRLVNHPIRSLRRYELLQRLHADGSNRFAARRATDLDAPLRYPVFVRLENEHNGSLTGLIHGEPDLQRTLTVLVMEGHDPRDLLVVEHCDTADGEGIYRKYSAFRIGDRILPRHVLFSRQWMLKDVDLLEPHHVEEIRAYCRENPHEAQIRALFDAADIHYGRIDYALQDGAIQVWEINTNPLVVRPPEAYPERQHRFHGAFAAAFNEAFAALDAAVEPGTRVPITWSAPPFAP
ncbi:Hypothetical protein A7982_06938 [Minicystis rosea]|nr:Hypothetical protein A7982_06938 [Minicystis rosea]